ncbi:hypothetical protein MJ585_10670 [Klebsiella pneumoniae]|nr:hypothetical protein MJ585_10670 [Klebsiella pneumoniae]
MEKRNPFSSSLRALASASAMVSGDELLAHQAHRHIHAFVISGSPLLPMMRSRAGQLVLLWADTSFPGEQQPLRRR